METRRGPTPLGGVRSTAVWFDRNGDEVEDPGASSVVNGEITEYSADDMVLGRTYVQRFSDPVPVTLSTPAGWENGNYPEDGNDGPKEAWDIWAVKDGVWQHPTKTKDELLVAQGWGHLPLVDQLRAVCNLMQLPVWNAAPAELKKDVYKWLEDNRQETLV